MVSSLQIVVGPPEVGVVLGEVEGRLWVFEGLGVEAVF
jgi:hypothetical protein